MMRYLLLSVLVVCVIGVMIPSVFGQADLFGRQEQEATPLSEAYATLINNILCFFYCGGSPIIPTGIVLAIIGAIIVGIIVYIRRKRKRI